jgi:hypothetical protein
LHYAKNLRAEFRRLLIQIITGRIAGQPAEGKHCDEDGDHPDYDPLNPHHFHGVSES